MHLPFLHFFSCFSASHPNQSHLSLSVSFKVRIQTQTHSPFNYRSTSPSQGRRSSSSFNTNITITIFPLPIGNKEDHMGKPTGSGYKPSSAKRSICTCITIFLLLAGITLLVLWLVYRPYKPRFKVVGAAIYGLNTTTPPLMSTTMQFTILIRNPNKRVSMYYDKFSTFVSYRNQAITPQVVLPPLYLEKHSTVSLSPVIGGTTVPVSPEVSNGLMVDESYGVVGLRLVFVGRLRWKAGAIRTAHYGLYVKCDLVMGLKKGFVGQVPLLGAPACYVDV